MKLVYAAILTPFDNNNGYTVEVPDLTGCVTEGENLASAIEMGIDAASGWILGELEQGVSFPSPSNPFDIVVPEGSLLNLLLLDMDAYAERYGSKSVRKNITIPAWLNAYGEKNNINFSKVLTDALLKQASK